MEATFFLFKRKRARGQKKSVEKFSLRFWTKVYDIRLRELFVFIQARYDTRKPVKIASNCHFDDKIRPSKIEY